MKMAHWGITVGILLILFAILVVMSAFIVPIPFYPLFVVTQILVYSGLFLALYGKHKTYNTREYGIGKEIAEEEDKIDEFVRQRGYDWRR